MGLVFVCGYCRIQHVKKLLNRVQKEVKFLQNRLDMHGDDWRNATVEEDVKPPLPSLVPSITIKTEKGSIKTEKNSMKSADKVKVEGDKKTGKKPTKRKGNRSEKAEKDPNAPKRPANPFFQFCQEQRQLLMEQLNAELKPGEPEPSKQELTRQLAMKWKSLSSHDKKVSQSLIKIKRTKIIFAGLRRYVREIERKIRRRNVCVQL